MKNSKSVWNVKEKQFPKNGKMQSKIKFLVRYGILAPSGHNSQPWIFEIGEKSLKILPDYTRTREAVDPENRELFISLGAAARNVEIAANYFGMIFDKETEEEEIVFKFKDGEKISTDESKFKAITQRWTNRGDFEERPVEKDLVNKLEHIEGKMTFVTGIEGKEKKEAAKLIYDSVVVWFRSKDLLNELEGWLRDDVEGTKDGLPMGTLYLYKLASNVKYFLMKDSPELKRKAERDAALALASPLLLVVSAKADETQYWVETGEIYQELSLELTGNGLSTGFFNTVTELGGQRKKLAKLLGINGKPQLLLRVGYGKDEIKHTPRRPIEEVIKVVE